MAVIIGLLIALIYLLTANYGPAQSNDTRAAAVASWNLATNGSLALPEDWVASWTFWGIEGRQSRLFTNRFPGAAYWATPSYLVARVIASDRTISHPLLVDTVPAAVAAAVTAAASALVLYLLFRDLASRSSAVIGTLVAALGTALWSVAADSMWPHGPAVLALASMLVLWRRSHTWAAAACAAIAILIRPHLVVPVIIIAAWGWKWGSRREGLHLTLGALLGLSGISGYTAWAFGYFLPIAGYDAKGHLEGLILHSPLFTLQSLALALVSPTRGLLVFSPFLVVSLFALSRHWRQLPPWTLAPAVAGCAYFLIQVRAMGHTGGAGFFSYRIALEPLVLAAPALFLATINALRSVPWLVRVMTVTSLLSLSIHAYGAMVGGIDPHVVDSWRDIRQELMVE